MGAEIIIRKDMEPDEIIELFLEAIHKLGFSAEEDELEDQIRYTFVTKQEGGFLWDDKNNGTVMAMSGQYITTYAPQQVIGKAPTPNNNNNP